VGLGYLRPVPDAPVPTLATKLGIGEGTTLALLSASPDLPLELPPGVAVKRQARGQADVVVAFFRRSALLEQRIDALGAMIFPGGGLWIAWPKKASGEETDMTDHAVRAVALPRGLVDNKVCAIDQTWTALRLVWRNENRPSERQTRRSPKEPHE
jgi:hypothetical protein